MSASDRRSGKSHALIVMAHPADKSLTRSVSEAVVGALEAQALTTEFVDLVSEGFDPVFGPADHAAYARGEGAPDDVLAEQRRIDRADHLILVYPVYWWSMPALLKGWIDRVFISGWAFEEGADGGISKKLDRLKVSLVAVAGANAATYSKRGYRDAMRVQTEDGIFDFCGARVISFQLITPDQWDGSSVPEDVASKVVAAISGDQEAELIAGDTSACQAPKHD